MRVTREIYPSGREGIIISGIGSSDLALTPQAAAFLAVQLHKATDPENKMSTWYLISGDTARKVQEALQAAIQRVERDCSAGGCMCDLHGIEHSEFYKDALHELDSGLHTTDAVPSDYTEIVRDPKAIAAPPP